MIKGYAERTDACRLIGKFRDLAMELNCSNLYRSGLRRCKLRRHSSKNKLQFGAALGWKTFRLSGPGRWGLEEGPGHEI